MVEKRISLKDYDHKAIEEKWQKYWLENKIYKYDKSNKDKPVFAIDTPPPYVSGEITPGNALNYVYCDAVARYKRMKGYNVHFPIGFDCHGLPTEVRVERILKKNKNELNWKEFNDACIYYTKIWIDDMIKSFKRLGISFDWDLLYYTMNEDYVRKIQLSFLLTFQKGYIYRGKHPIYWCPRCETAIAEAEVEYSEETRSLYYIKFKLENNEDLLIATTRPEMLGACVAVAANPNDERYTKYSNMLVEVPLYKTKVPFIYSNEIDMNFGTGAMMVCTFGDKRDVKIQARYNLPINVIFDESGRIKDSKFEPIYGLKIQDARTKIVEELRKQNLLVKEERIVSEVGKCWRCHTNVEIIEKEQWFVSSIKLNDELLKMAKEIKWIPPFQYKRLEDWVNSLTWDWVISRQRVFGTPIPIWYCKNCKYILLAKEDWLPVDPRIDKPKINRCPNCGHEEFEGEKDVLDTWFDSSMTCAIHAGWPDNFDPRLLPSDLQPNGYDIIRTWDYYLLLRHLILFNLPAFKTALINGMVKGTDGRMMHKSYGNVIPLDELFSRYGCDAFRLWALGSVKTGSDIAVRFEDFDFNRRFLIKLWNAAKYVLTYTNEVDEKEVEIKNLIDSWILNLLQKTINNVNKFLEEYNFFEAINEIRTFVWNKFCDQYLEAIKHRTAKQDKAAFLVLRKTLHKILLLLAPFAPHVTEEIYGFIEKKDSIHLQSYPSENQYDDEKIKKGDIVISVIAELRRIKVRNRIPLSKSIKEVKIYAGNLKDLLEDNKEDISATLKILNLIINADGKGSIKSEDLENVSYDIQFE